MSAAGDTGELGVVDDFYEIHRGDFYHNIPQPSSFPMARLMTEQKEKVLPGRILLEYATTGISL